MSASGVQLHLGRAQDFLSGMQLLRDDAAYRNSSALLAIHSAVSYTDALRIGPGESVLAAEDHLSATQALRRLLPTQDTETNNGMRHLEGLISKKSQVAYGFRRLDANEYEQIFTRAERFARWVNGVGKQLRIEGWRDDAY